MTHALAVATHVAIGTVALALYWGPLLSRKGSARHRKAGRAFLALLLPVALTVGPVLLLRPGPFDPAYLVQMLYLVVCLGTVGMLAFTAIRWKDRPERFRGRHFRILGPVLLGLGAVVLAAGLAEGDALAIVLSWVGLVYGGAMIAFARTRRQLHPRWWLGWHLNAVCGLFNAAHGTFLAMLAVRAGLLADATATQVGFQLATVAAALGLRLWFGRRYGAPLRFADPTAPAAPLAARPA